MKKNVLLFILTFVFLALGSNDKVSAQSCNPGPICCNAPLQVVCNSGCSQNGLGNCVNTTTGAACGSSMQCLSGTFQAPCGYNFGVCQHNVNTCNYVSGSCGSPIGGCPSGQQMCGGCINACRANTQTCNQWIAAECPGSTAPPGGGGSAGSCDGCMDAGSCADRRGSYGGAGSGGCNPAVGGYCSGTTFCGGGGGPTPPPPTPDRCSISAGKSTVAPGETTRLLMTYVPAESSSRRVWTIPDMNVGYIFIGAGRQQTTFSSSTYTYADFTGVAPGSVRVNMQAYTSGAGYEQPGAACSKIMTVSAPPAGAPTVNLQANNSDGPIFVPTGTSVNLSWTSSNATSCSGSATYPPDYTAWRGARPTSGTVASGAISANVRFNINCTGPGGTATDSVMINIGSPPPTVNLLANNSSGPITIANNTSATLSWSTTNATSCTASGPWSGSKAISGSEGTGNMTTNRTYSLTCTGPGGSTTDTVTVNVQPSTPTPTSTPPTVDLRVNTGNGPVSVPSNSSVTLSWTSTNATSCTASNAWTGSKSTNGSESASGITSNRTYTITCTGPGGSVSDSVTVNVAASTPVPTLPPGVPTVDLRANNSSGPISIPTNTSATLSWGTTNATSCTASNAWTGARATAGSQSSGNITSSRTFTLTCTGPGGTSSDSVVINVAAATPSPTPPTVDLRGNSSNGPLNVPYNSSFNLSWSSTFANSCTASGRWTGSKATSGTQSSGPVTISGLYTLSCTGTGGNAVDNVNVNVTGGPSCTINAPSGETQVTVGQTATMTPVVATQNGGVIQSVTYSTSGTGFTIVPPATKSSAPYTVTVTGVTPSFNTMTMTATLATGQTCSSTTGVRTLVMQCNSPVPYDPPAQTCPSAPTASDGSITWAWAPVQNANRYRIVVRRDNPTTGQVVFDSNMIGQGTFGPTCNFGVSGAICTQITDNLSPAHYFSTIQAEGTCGPSAWSAPKEVDLLSCVREPWWQADNGHVITQSNIRSEIPTSGIPLIESGSGGTPGIAFGGQSGSINTGSGEISPTNWNALSPFSGRQPSFSDFATLIPVSLTPSDPGATVGGNAFNTGGATTGDGYHWYRRNGDLNVTSDITLNSGRKVILFVNGNVNISGRITYNPANSFLIILSGGNISVAPTVTTAGTTPTITGIFYSNGNFTTGAGSSKLNVLGSVVALGGVTLERDLGALNATEPAESFTISPELLLNYPATLSFKRPVWREVSP